MEKNVDELHNTKSEIIGAITKPHPRVELYARIIAEFTHSIESFYLQRPEWIGDKRSKEAIEKLYNLVGEVFHIIDDYDIERKKDNETDHSGAGLLAIENNPNSSSVND